MKLSEPQARVLRTMYKYDCAVVSSWASSDGRYEGSQVPTMPHPRWNTLDSLFWYRDLISQERDEIGRFIYRLTPKGREIAKELQDAEAE